MRQSARFFVIRHVHAKPSCHAIALASAEAFAKDDHAFRSYGGSLFSLPFAWSSSQSDRFPGTRHTSPVTSFIRNSNTIQKWCSRLTTGLAPLAMLDVVLAQVLTSDLCPTPVSGHDKNIRLTFQYVRPYYSLTWRW